MIELFPNLDHMDFPRAALVPREQAAQLLAACRQKFAAQAKDWAAEKGYSLRFLDG